MEQLPSFFYLVICALSFLVFSFGLLKHRQYKTYKKYIQKRTAQLKNNSVHQILQYMRGKQIKVENSIDSGRVTHEFLRETIQLENEKAKFILAGLPPPAFSTLDSESLKSAVKECREAQYLCIQKGKATQAFNEWTWFGSKKDGATMLRHYRELLLRAFNAEFEVIRKQMRHNTFDKAVEKLEKLAEQLEKLGETTQSCIANHYQKLKYEELNIWRKSLVKREKDKQERKAQQAKLREQKKLAMEDTDELDEEISAYESDLRKAQKKAQALAGKERAKLELLIAQIKEEKARLEDKFARAQSQAQFTRAGFIYVISNKGSFGDGIIKIGMTRRLEPMDRVTELGDASVPFRFDVHALAFVEDAPALENKLHKQFTDRRVNQENLRKEFFKVTPEEVRSVMTEIGINTDWYLSVEAREYQESQLIRQATEQKQSGLFDELPEEI